jgi:hypothetical protein
MKSILAPIIIVALGPGVLRLLSLQEHQNARPAETQTQAILWRSRIGEQAFLNCGLQSLDEPQLLCLWSVLESIPRDRALPGEIEVSAEAFMRNNGWDTVQIAWGTLEGHTALVCDDRRLAGRSATKSVPLGLSAINSPAGVYWGHRSWSGRLESLVDRYGNEHSFLLAKWVTVRD